MSIAGTFIGAVFGLFTAFLYAGNPIKKSYVRIVVRVIVQCVRTIPVLILALVATFIWGLVCGGSRNRTCNGFLYRHGL